jgi:hypothetical protein
MNSSSSDKNTDDSSNISIVADSPSCNTRAASSAGQPKKKTKTKWASFLEECTE